MTPTRAVPGRLLLGLITIAVAVGGLLMAAGGRPAHASPAPAPAAHTAATAASATPTPPPAPSPSPSGATAGPVPIQVGPPGLGGPPIPVPGSGGNVGGGGQPSPGLFDITGHITAAIDAWFRDLVTSALNPVLTVLGHTLLATPDVTAQGRVGQLWRATAGIADAALVLFVLAGGAIVMGHETLQTRYAAKDILPRVVVAAVATNASLGLAGVAINTADALSSALLGTGVQAGQAAVVLRQLVLGSMADGGIFLVLLGGVVAVLALVLLATFVIRLALTVLLVVAAPLALVCHALPQTEGLARLWWRAFCGVLLIQVGQSLVLIAALRVFLASGGPASLGIASSGGLVDLLVAACLCWVLVRIPSWVSRQVFAGGRRHGGGAGRLVRDLVVYKGARALVGAVGL